MNREHTDSSIVRLVSRASVPFIQLYALYVLGHGEDGPGGGFQGGVIFAAAFVLLGLVDGWDRGRRRFPQPVTDTLMPMGALIYAGIGFVALLAGGAFLQYEAFGHGHHAHAFGLMGIEFGVTVTVAASIATLFFEMSRPKLFLDPPRRKNPR